MGDKSTVHCPNCHRAYQLSRGHSGKRARCGACKARFVVPDSGPDDAGPPARRPAPLPPPTATRGRPAAAAPRGTRPAEEPDGTAAGMPVSVPAEAAGSGDPSHDSQVVSERAGVRVKRRSGRRRGWGTWVGLATSIAVAALGAVAMGLVVAAHRPLDKAGLRQQLSERGYTFREDDSSPGGDDMMKGDVWGTPVGGVTIYHRVRIMGRGSTATLVGSDVFLKPRSERKYDETPFVEFHYTQGHPIRPKEKSVGASAAPALVDQAQLDFERVVSALR